MSLHQSKPHKVPRYSAFILGFFLCCLLKFSQAEITFDSRKDPPSSSLRANSGSISSNPPMISMAMGQVLSSINLAASSVVLSEDGKTAFVNTQLNLLQIFDVSNLQSPTIISSIKLSYAPYPFQSATLALSPDEKILYASNMYVLEIIDVSNLASPVILSKFEDPDLAKNIQQSSTRAIQWEYYVSFATSRDNQTLFIGGLGIQVFDISDKTKPNLIGSASLQVNVKNLYLSEIKVSSKKDILYLVSEGILSIFDIKDPSDFKTLGSYSSENYQISSLLLSQQSEAAFLLGKDEKNLAMCEKIDLTDPTQPVKIKSYNLNYNAGNQGLSFSKLSFNENTAFIIIHHNDIGVLNLWENDFRVEDKSLAKGNIFSLAVSSSDESKIVIGQDRTLKVIELFTHYPNNRIFSFSKNSLGSLKSQGPKIYSTILFSDEKTLLVHRAESYATKETFIEIVNISNYSNPILVSSVKVGPTYQVQLLQDEKKAILVHPFIGLSLLDLSNLLDLKVSETFSKQRSIDNAQFSSDGKIGFLVSSTNGIDSALQVFDFSSDNFTNGNLLSKIAIKDITAQSLLGKNNDILIVLGMSQIFIFDVSNPAKSRQISSTSVTLSSDFSRKTLSAALSPDEKTLYLQVFTYSRLSLIIYDLCNLTSLTVLSDTTLPFTRNTDRKEIAFSSDYKTAYISSAEGYILSINITNTTSPFIQGTFRVADLDEPLTFKLTKDVKTVIYSQDYTLRIASLAVPHTLYLSTESVRLGEKYSGPVGLFRLNPKQRYEIFDESYKYVSVSLFDIKINITNKAPECTHLSLPYWMNFDKDNRIFSLEPKKPQNLGAYTLHSVFSPRIPDNAFASLNLGQDQEDLFATLVGLGYIDNKKFLTSNLGSLQEFIMTKAYLSYKNEIYSILKNYYLETFTTFDIFSSLDVLYDDKISLKTLSDDPIHVEIKLCAGHGKFINKPYGSVIPKITEGSKSGIVLEGSEEEINAALEKLVINLDVENPTFTCDGTIVISDHLNPVVTKSFANISKFFEINQPPQVKKPIQEQIDQAQNIYTGVYFVIPLAQETFADSFNAGLNYELAIEEPFKSVPTWLSFNNMSFHGTPPEEITGLEMNLILVVRNEFKMTRVPIVLRIKISPIFALKLLAKYSPMILSIIGLIVYFNRIYNVVFKKRYRYRKEFHIAVGKEITPQMISPIAFIYEERQESFVILDYLKEILKKEDGVDNNNKLAYYFSNKDNSRLDQEKLEKKIEEVLSEAPESITKKLEVYFKGAEANQKLINRMVFNQLALWFLDSHKETKRTFEEVKENWVDLVDWDENSLCKVNDRKLHELISNGKDIENKDNYVEIRGEINIDLLKDAIESYAFTKQSIDYLAIKAHVIIREKKQRNFLLKLIKRDLQVVNFSDKGKMGYGMSCKIENDVLSFYGAPHDNFANKILVVQITSKRQRILREIWIHGISNNRLINNAKASQAPVGNERISRGKEYEVY